MQRYCIPRVPSNEQHDQSLTQPSMNSHSASTDQRRAHWEGVYATKPDADLSWFQSFPTVSLALTNTLNPPPIRVLDVGGGQSALACELLTRRPSDPAESIAVLDISGSAIVRAKARATSYADRIRWIVGDVLESPYLGTVDLWHDRAVFHFLHEVDDRKRYVDLASRTVVSGGHAIIATFALSGPERCSGLPVCRYNAETLAAEFTPAFQMINSVQEQHETPWGKSQEFIYGLFIRR